MKTAIIDGDSLIFFAFHPNKVLDEAGEPLRADNKFVYQDKTEDEIRASCDYLMQDLLLTSKATHYCLFIKGKNTISDRKAVNTEYKANRPKEKPKMWDFTKDYFISQWKAILVNDIEVDDAVNITRLNIPDSFICAIDKDLLGLEGTHYNWNKKEWVEVNKSQASLKFWTDMITGQSGDNIKGIPGKGIKYAEILFKKLNYRTDLEYAELVFSAYLVNLGLKGIQEFYKNYMCLYILEEKEGFILPEVIEFKNDSVGKEESIQNEA